MSLPLSPLPLFMHIFHFIRKFDQLVYPFKGHNSMIKTHKNQQISVKTLRNSKTSRPHWELKRSNKSSGYEITIIVKLRRTVFGCSGIRAPKLQTEKFPEVSQRKNP